ncbi:MAG: HIT family protein [Cohaesibacter sp.]|nr:HIT family protein [Cohaesibacter sp.]MCV6602986.1 HIT family protein [Cohaesibacter sp.]
MSDFSLDPRLKADSLALCELELCTVRLAKDANYPWLIMVPKVADMVELIDLSLQDQHKLTDEIALVSGLLRSVTHCDKLNVAALGNMVRQLHIHVIARFEEDGAWPGPIWGVQPAKAYDGADQETLITALQAGLAQS